MALIHTTNASTYEYTHETIIGGSNLYAHFKIRAVLPYEFSTFSNTVNINILNRSGAEKEVHELSQTPIQFTISNHPNPFNPATIINYSLPEDGYTELKVYNIYGELIETLLSENKSAGSYSIQFPASGKYIASGVYLYTLNSGKHKTSGKMIMMK